MYTFLALGDSYTVGEGVAAGECWPVQLASRLHDQGIGIAAPRIVATTGWTTDELAVAMTAAEFEPPYALVTLLIGVNNQYRGLPLGEYRAQFHALLQRAIKLAGGNAAHVIVVSIPDWGWTPLAQRERREQAVVAEQIDAFNAAARAETGAARARWADVTAISRRPESRAELVADGLHPSGAQYARWVDVILPLARTAFRQK